MQKHKISRLALVALTMTAGLLSACADPEPVNGAGSGGRSGSDLSAPSGTAVGRSAIDSGDLAGADQLAREWTDRVGDRVFFDTDKSVIRPDGRDQLAKWVVFLKQHPANRLLIEGHSDEHGTREYNLALGERRATAAKEFLEAAGIPAERITIVSYGKERPAVIGSNDAAWSQNRRAVGILQ
jgi:peptidoglycan-associated lipoprotein